MSRLLILPTPLSSSSISVGQLITDPIHGETVSFSPTSTPTSQESNIQSKYQTTIAHDEYGRFISTTSKRTHIAQDNLLNLNAEESLHTSITQPRATFDNIRRDAATQAFLRKSAMQRQPLYYVTAIQSLKNPSFHRPVIEEANVTEAPASEIRLPMHVRRVDSASSFINTNDANDKTQESVIAVELLKVRCHVGPVSEPHSIEDIDYEWSYHSLDDEGLQLSIGLGKALAAAEFRALAGITIDGEFTDASWDSHSEDDDDGIGGF